MSHPKRRRVYEPNLFSENRALHLKRPQNRAASFYLVSWKLLIHTVYACTGSCKLYNYTVSGNREVPTNKGTQPIQRTLTSKLKTLNSTEPDRASTECSDAVYRGCVSAALCWLVDRACATRNPKRPSRIPIALSSGFKRYLAAKKIIFGGPPLLGIILPPIIFPSPQNPISKRLASKKFGHRPNFNSYS
jgi:hypothetical protein